MSFTEKQLKALVERRHPHYSRMKPHWDFLETTYQGGRGWFKGNVFQYLKEGDIEYAARLDRAYRFNHSREVVNLINKYVFKGIITRKTGDVSTEVEQFWKSATRDGFDVEQFMKQVDIHTSCAGRVWIMTDSTADETQISVADQKVAGAKVYAYIVPPQAVLDVGYDEGGKPLWILIYESDRDDEDPFTSSGEVRDRYRLWTREEWFLIGEEQVAGSKKRRFRILNEGVHGLGIVPGFPVDNMGVSDNPYFSTSLIDDIAYLDRAVANYLSNLDAIIQDQTFSQLAMPAQNIVPGSNEQATLVEMGTKRIFTYDGSGTGKPEYLSPDPKQAELIVMVIKTIINEIYHSVGVAGERTKSDNSMGIDNSSGVAKAYDFERVKSLLKAKADALERAENRLVHLVKLWNGESHPEDDIFQLVKYPEEFDVRSVYDELDLAQKLSLLGSPDGVMQEQMRRVVEKLFPHLKQDLKDRLLKEVSSWSQMSVSTDDKSRPSVKKSDEEATE